MKRSTVNLFRLSPPLVLFFYPTVVLSLLYLQLVSVSLFCFALASPSSFRSKTTLSLLFTTSSYRHAAPYYSSYVNEFRLIIWERSRTENENGGNVGVRGLAPKRGWRCFRYTVKDCPWIHCDGTLPALENFSSPISLSFSPSAFLFLFLVLSDPPPLSTSSLPFLHFSPCSLLSRINATLLSPSPPSIYFSLSRGTVARLLHWFCLLIALRPVPYGDVS